MVDWVAAIPKELVETERLRCCEAYFTQKEIENLSKTYVFCTLALCPGDVRSAQQIVAVLHNFAGKKPRPYFYLPRRGLRRLDMDDRQIKANFKRIRLTNPIWLASSDFAQVGG